ncbi:MAG: hypothetical protein R3F46_03660 [bacterium]
MRCIRVVLKARAKGASWLDQRGFNPGVNSGLVKGQYKPADTDANGVPDFAATPAVR